MVYSQTNIKQLGTIVGVWAHPDDEMWASAGLMAAAIENGQRVLVICLTGGEAGKTADQQRFPQENLRVIRPIELRNALMRVGVSEYKIFDFPDGELSEAHTNQAVDAIAEVLREVSPDTVLSFGKHGITGHGDHILSYKWAKQAMSQTSLITRHLCAVESREKHQQAGDVLDKKFDIYFATESPERVSCHDADVMFELSDELLSKKLAALAAHESQTAQLFADPEAASALQIIASCECFVSG